MTAAEKKAVAELEQQLAAALSEKTAAQEKLAQLEKELQALKAEKNKVSTPTDRVSTFNVDGIEYAFIKGLKVFMLNGDVCSVEQILKNENKLRFLVASKSGVIERIESSKS